MATKSILFVCLGKLQTIILHNFRVEVFIESFFFKGNICRSPMGEAIFHDLATKNGVRDKVWNLS